MPRWNNPNCGFQKGHSPYLTQDTRKKMSEAHKGKKRAPFSEETRKKMSKNHSHHWLGKRYSPEHRKNMSESHKGKHTGFLCNWWKGGISCEPYTTDWTIELRRAIRERDHYICRLCGNQQGDTAFDVHHIDYDKKNCCPENLITLCRKCHIKTNSHRDYWLKFFNK